MNVDRAVWRPLATKADQTVWWSLPDGVRVRYAMDGRLAQVRLLAKVTAARHRIALRNFVWRDDRFGNELGRALLAAADRGVRVLVHKDAEGGLWEQLEGNGQSFFHKYPQPTVALAARLLSVFYGHRWPSPQHPNAIAGALCRHPRVRVRKDHHAVDHAKLSVFDDDSITIGSMGIGDDFGCDRLDVFVEVDGASAVDRLRCRLAGSCRFDRLRPIDFLVGWPHTTPKTDIAAERNELIISAKRSINGEVAYVDDREAYTFLQQAARRGVCVSLLTTASSNVLRHRNAVASLALARDWPRPQSIKLAYSHRLVHSKIMTFDGVSVELGSANFTRLSRGRHAELDIHVCQPEFVAAIEREMHERVARNGGAFTPQGLHLPWAALEGVVVCAHLALARFRKGTRQQLRQEFLAAVERTGIVT